MEDDDGNSHLVFSICGTAFAPGGEGTDMNPGTCVNDADEPLSGRAFLAPEGTDCEYSFQYPTMSAFRELETEPEGLLGGDSAGFNIRFESTEDCAAAEVVEEGDEGEDEEQKSTKVIVDL